MAHGRPCLGARAGGIPEIISPETGVLPEYGDAPGIARETIGALNRDWDEQSLLNRAHEFSYENFRSRLANLIPT
jgi:glycosyltransferase involved in cell wall biosynthesis